MELNFSKGQDNNAAPFEDIKNLYLQFVEKYNKVFIDQFGDAGVFIYKTLGRKDFRTVIENKDLTFCDKEEIICNMCTLYPQNYDFANCEMGGLPTLLSNRIIELSLLGDVKKQVNAIHYFRDKISNDLDEQINLVIHEAFPEFTIDEIANFDAEKAAEYMTRAEYILHNLRGVPLSPTGVDYQDLNEQNNQMSMEERFKPVTNQIGPQEEVSQKTKIGKDSREKSIEELEREFPNIDWRHDSVTQRGMDAFKNIDVADAALASLDPNVKAPDAALQFLKNKYKDRIAKQDKKDNKS
jgi:hypothetical protein